MKQNRRRLMQTAAALGAVAAAPAVFSQAAPYPSNVIKFVIPTQAGGGHDAMMRLIGQKLQERWGQPSIVESKPGGSGVIATVSVERAAPDGYTVLMIHSGLITNLVLQTNPGYKLADFVPVSMLALTPIALGVRKSLGVKTLKDYVALAKSKPGKLSYGSYGQGSGGHFAGEQLNLAAGIDTVHVPYKGAAPAIQDLLGAQTDAAMVTLGGVMRYPEKIVPLAVASPTRFSLYPDVPTFIESGYPTVNMPGWAALLLPAKTPAAIVSKMTAEMNRIVKLPDVEAKLLELGFEPAGWGPAQLKAFMEDQLAKVSKLVQDGRVKI